MIDLGAHWLSLAKFAIEKQKILSEKESYVGGEIKAAEQT